MAALQAGSAGMGTRGVICLAFVASVVAMPLAVARSPDQRVRVKLDVTGVLFAAAGRAAESVHEPITVAAAFDFLESPAGDASEDSPEGAEKAVATRRYFDATAEISIAGQSSRTVLAADARLLSVARQGTMALPFLRESFLSRDEIDLLETPFDSILLDELLPKSPMADGDAWQVPGDVTAGLLAIDTVENGTLEARLVTVVAGTATIALAGAIDGAIDGVPTHVVVEGTFTATAREEEDRHVIEGGVAGIAVVLRERRQASHVAPGFEVEARLDLKRSPADAAADVAGEDASAADEQVAAATLRRRGSGRPGLIWHRDAAGRYDLVYDSRWRSVEDSPSGHVLRLVDHGALVAQCSITALPRANADVTSTIEEVQRDIKQSLAGQFGQFAGATEFERDAAAAGAEEGAAGSRGKIKVVRVASTGTAEGLPFRWIHYVLTDGEGRRASVTFMLEASLEKRFGDADRALVDGLQFEPEAVREARLPEKTLLP